MEPGALGVTEGPSCSVTAGAGAFADPDLRWFRESTEALSRPALQSAWITERAVQTGRPWVLVDRQDDDVL